MEHLFKLLNEEEKRKQQTKEVALFNTPKPTTTTSKPVAVTTPTKDILPSEAALAVKPVEKSGFFERINWKQVAIWGTIVAAVVTIIAVPCALLIGGGGTKKITSNDFWTQAVTPRIVNDTPQNQAFSATDDNRNYIKSNLSENIFYLGFYGNLESTDRVAWIKHIEIVDAYLATFPDEVTSAGGLKVWLDARPWVKDETTIPPVPASYGVTRTFWSSTATSGEVVFSIANGTIPITISGSLPTELYIRPLANSTIDTLNSILDSYSVIFLTIYDDLLNDGSGKGAFFYNVGTTISNVDVSNLTDTEE